MSTNDPLNQSNDDGEGDLVGNAGPDPFATTSGADGLGVNHVGLAVGTQVPGAELVPVSTVTRTTGAIIAQVTQVRRPWRATARTVFQAAVGLATLLPFVATGVYGNDGDYPAAVTQVLVVDAAITRVMALPQVEEFLQKFLPFLSAAPKKG